MAGAFPLDTMAHCPSRRKIWRLRKAWGGGALEGVVEVGGGKSCRLLEVGHIFRIGIAQVALAEGAGHVQRWRVLVKLRLGEGGNLILHLFRLQNGLHPLPLGSCVAEDVLPQPLLPPAWRPGMRSRSPVPWCIGVGRRGCPAACPTWEHRPAGRR